MPSRCVVGGCSNKPDAKKGIKLHIIPYFGDDCPVAKGRRRKWIDLTASAVFSMTNRGENSIINWKRAVNFTHDTLLRLENCNHQRY